MTFSRRLQIAVARADLNRNRLAKRLQRNYAEVHEWWKGSRMPNAESLVALSRAPDVSTDWLLGLVEDVGETDHFRTFIAEAAAEGITVQERRVLTSWVWPSGAQPTVESYRRALSALRACAPMASQLRFAV